MKIHRLQAPDIKIPHLETPEQQSVCFAGSNRSGILSLFRVISGKTDNLTVQILELPQDSVEISFETHQEIYEAELEKDETDYIGRLDAGTPARQFLFSPENHMKLIRAFEMDHMLDKGYRELSTGQTRKLLLLSSITKGAGTLLLLSPYDGLDAAARNELNRSLALMHKQGILIFLFVHNLSDIPAWCPFLVLLYSGKIAFAGPSEAADYELVKKIGHSAADFKGRLSDMKKAQNLSISSQTPLIELKNGRAGYKNSMVFSNLSLMVRKGDHTLVTGPNGSGKSTLLHMVTGDHPACYQNDLKVFGIRRGSGESIWELKKQMGIVSSELHRNYRVPGSVLACVVSGLFDSIGVYQKVSHSDQVLAGTWLDRIGLADKASESFRSLSYADQRLTLVARALIKSPQLLILDEPTQGLDQANRTAILDFIEMLALENYTTVLYVSHREDEFRNFFSQQIRMK